VKIGRKDVKDDETYFIADIASNHDGSFERAQRLIDLAAQAGADAVKFQHFRAETLVSKYGFEQLGKLSHQSSWKKSVYDTYKDYEVPLDWTATLKRTADDCGVDFLTTPYDLDILSDLADYVCAWKVGSGDINYLELISALNKYNKPIIIATGASALNDIYNAISMVRDWDNLAILQCNTNYSGESENLKYVNLRVINGYKQEFTTGLSDHTQGYVTVLGAIALGGRVFEKHFTDDNSRQGPDHKFSMSPLAWALMMKASRELVSALGDGTKRVEANEMETLVLQRRALRAARDLTKGERLQAGDIACLRPCPSDGIPATGKHSLIGMTLGRDIAKGDLLCVSGLSQSDT
jgi:sialic acid synthase SpsE